ncbi:MAG: 6,7-dimethyl-8-ribityllumazine synthase [Actinobacteria bacterium]|nr:MAG: 6,7-dimethyl-8-ribityllumazine synthase [Actinomycetota bacterium]
MRHQDSSAACPSAEGLRVGVVTAVFHERITSGLKAGAVEFLREAGAAEIHTVDAPGAFEVPLLAQRLATSGYDAVVCLGAVIEGETDHYEHVAHRASEGLMRVQLDTGIPIAFGILTVRSVESAVARSQPGKDNKGREAAIAAVSTANTLRGLTKDD